MTTLLHPVRLEIVAAMKAAGGTDLGYSVIAEKVGVDPRIALAHLDELAGEGLTRRSNFVEIDEKSGEQGFSLIPAKVAEAVSQIDTLLQPLRG